jgi:hypothetical protein
MTTREQFGKPLPDILPETAGYWEAARRHELVFQQCRSCEQKIFFPRLMCHRCLSKDLDWVKSSGRGTVYSYTIIYQVAHESFASDVPYVYAIIELEEGVRMISNVINADPLKLRIGMAVKVVFEKATEEISIPKFEPVTGQK